MLSSARVKPFKLGAFEVCPVSDRLSKGSKSLKIEPQIMNVLMLLVDSQGSLVQREEFMAKIWQETDVSDEVLTRAISVLRRHFRSEDAETEYIQTVPKRGYVLHPDLECMGHSDRPQDGSGGIHAPRNSEATALYLQGRSLLKQPFIAGALDNAIDYFREALSIEGASADLFAALAEGYYQKLTFSQAGDKHALMELAVQNAERALVLNPDMAFPLSALAMNRFLSSDIVGALDLAFRAFDLAPAEPEIAMRLGYLLAIIGKTRQAIPYFELAISRDPTRGRYFQCLAQAKLCNDELDEAERLAKKAIDLHHLFAYDTYAAVAYAKGEDDLAAQRFTQGCLAMHSMFGAQFGPPEIWEKYAGQVFSRDPDIRKLVAQWLVISDGNDIGYVSIPVMTVLMRTGSAQAIFDACGNGPPIGSHGALLRMWGSVDTCRMIYTHPKFPDFARRIGMAAAWAKYGAPDRPVYPGPSQAAGNHHEI
nr:winged helix-turn-helix domain-containing protein [Primorskyibacter sedentarius]